MILYARFARFARFARSLTEYRNNISKFVFVLALVVSYSSLCKFASSLRLCTSNFFCIAYFLRLPNV